MDIFNLTIVVCLFAPLLGAIVNVLTEGRRTLKRNTIVLVVYYGISAVLQVWLWPPGPYNFSWRLGVAPCLLIVLGAFVGIGLAVAPGVSRRRAISGKCRQCGYNLTGNVSGTCPECGTVVDWLKQ